jgi:hypothetical protein
MDKVFHWVIIVLLLLSLLVQWKWNSAQMARIQTVDNSLSRQLNLLLGELNSRSLVLEQQQQEQEKRLREYISKRSDVMEVFLTDMKSSVQCKSSESGKQ